MVVLTKLDDRIELKENTTMTYRSTHPFRVVGEVIIWQGHAQEQVKAMKDALAKLKEQGINSLNDE